MDRLRATASGRYRPPPKDEFDIQSDTLFGGLAHLHLPAPSASLGDGIVLRSVYARLIAPYLLAFSPPAKPNAPHPGPWTAIGEGGLTITTEIELARSALPLNFDRLNSLWFIVALLRLRSALPIQMPVLSDRPIDQLAEATETANIVAVELQYRQLITAPPRSLEISDLDWVRCHLPFAAAMMQDPIFNRAFQTLDSASHSIGTGAGIVTVWASVETLLQLGDGQITARLCRALAAYLCKPGPDRDRAFGAIERSYRARGGAAHAGVRPEITELQQAFALARGAFIRSIESRRMPDLNDLLAQWSERR